LVALNIEINLAEIISLVFTIAIPVFIYKKVMKNKREKDEIMKRQETIANIKKQERIDKIQKDKSIVMKNSPKCIKAIELSTIYNNRIKKYSNNHRQIRDREYSAKSFERQTFEDVLKYNIENNIESIRNDIALIEENNNLYNNMLNEINSINSLEKDKITELGFTEENFKSIEKSILSEVTSTKLSNLTVSVQIYMQAKSGKIYREKHHIFSNDELLKAYNDWKNKPNYKKYETTAGFERRELNRDLRFAVLKRDNYRCCICGRNAKDGVKLEIDHIVPVSKGGKTVITNLQTLCQDCNQGKWSHDM